MKAQLLYVDPPWPENQAMFSRSGSSNHYGLLQAKDILNLPVSQAAERDAVLFLWSTGRHLPLALECVATWGFKHINVGFVWIKTTKDLSRPHNCLGSLTNTAAEFVLYARRGSFYQPAVADEMQVIFAPRHGPHSAKPVQSWERIERLYPDLTKLEIFGRNERPGWTVLGNEIDGRDIRESLPEFIRS